jgi:DNA-binding response OmpR family regulator
MSAIATDGRDAAELLDALPDDQLLARVRAALRAAEALPPEPEPERVVAGELVVDPRTRGVAVAGRRVALATKEFELLLRLASDPTRCFTKEELLRDVWGFRSVVRTRTLDSHASRLRLKLRGAGAAAYVVNVWGIGYKLVEESFTTA